MRVKKNITLKLKSSKHILTESAKIITLSFLISTLCFIASDSSVSALSAQEDVDLQFTFVPSLSISLSSRLIHIDNLTPGNYANSNTIRINVITNNTFGYTLTATVGDEDGTASNELVNGDSEAVFSSLASNDQLTLSNFDPNYWGYTTATSISDSSLYSGLTYGANTTINKTMNPSGRAFREYSGTNTTSFTIGASASHDQFSGEYTNVIGFEAIANVDTDVKIYMQDVTKVQLANMLQNPGDTMILYDKRDESDYKITNINGSFWMTQNLRYVPISGTILSPNTTNISSEIILETVGTLATGNSCVEPRIQPSDDASYGIYYNYCAASSGTICNNTEQKNAEEDICPAGWRLPAQNDGEAVINASNKYIYEPATAGVYYGGTSYYVGTRGFWWLSDAMTDANQGLIWYLKNNSLWGIEDNGRDRGYSVRCVKSDS